MMSQGSSPGLLGVGLASTPQMLMQRLALAKAEMAAAASRRAAREQAEAEANAAEVARIEALLKGPFGM